MRFFLALLLVIPSIALADSVQLGWDIPTQYVNNDPLPPSDIDGYTIKRWHNNERLDDINVTGALTLEHLMQDAQVGVYVFMIATVAKGMTGPYSDPHALPLGLVPVSGAKAPGIQVRLVCDTDPATETTKCNLEVK